MRLGRDNRGVLELRLVCASLWLLVLLAVVKKSPEASSSGKALAIGLCLLAIGADLARWHEMLRQGTRGWLKEEDVYSARALLKLAIGAGLMAAGWFFLRRIRRWPAGCGLRRGVLGVAAWLVWLLAWTAFLDDVLPRAFGHPAMRYGIEMVWACLTVLLVTRSKTKVEDPYG